MLVQAVPLTVLGDCWVVLDEVRQGVVAVGAGIAVGHSDSGN